VSVQIISKILHSYVPAFINNLSIFFNYSLKYNTIYIDCLNYLSDKGSIMTTSIIKLFTELLVIDEQIALIDQKLKVEKQKRAKKAAAIEAAEAALREGEKRAKELTAIHNRKQAWANEQQALREFEAAKAINLLFQKW
jgi:hypothetical protein